MFIVESREREATTTIRVVVPDSLHKRLGEAAQRANVDIQEVVRQAIVYAFRQSEGASPSASGRKRKNGLKESRACGSVQKHHPEPLDNTDAAPVSRAPEDY
ncbi:hypothetical protein [Geothrix paludis]|uniref:hypothetical protein n=1 Tax=Geothrix paludis TaxID=2922722 RepID=UPI001FAE0888|nr:hypothetical protein [Geothrix paludis]